MLLEIGSVIKAQQISCSSASNEAELARAECRARPRRSIVAARQAVATGGDNYVKACETQAGEGGDGGRGVDGSSFPPVSHRCMSHCNYLIVCLSRYADVQALVLSAAEVEPFRLLSLVSWVLLLRFKKRLDKHALLGFVQRH